MRKMACFGVLIRTIFSESLQQRCIVAARLHSAVHRADTGDCKRYPPGEDDVSAYRNISLQFQLSNRHLPETNGGRRWV